MKYVCILIALAGVVACTCISCAVGNRQKKAKAMIEASGLKMIAVEDFDQAARTVSHHTTSHNSITIVCVIHYANIIIVHTHNKTVALKVTVL